MSNSLVCAQEDLLSLGGADAGSDTADHDPLAEDMVPAEINKRLRVSRRKVDSSKDETMRAQWTRTTEVLQMQLQRLEALEDDFKLEAIEHPVDSPPFPLPYLDQMRHKYRDFKTAHLQLKSAHQAAQKRIQVAQQAYNAARQNFTILEEEGGTAEDKRSAELSFQLGMESYIYARLDARLINQKLKQAGENMERIGASLPDIEQDVVFSSRDYGKQLQKIRERKKMLNDALGKTRLDIALERKLPEAARVQLDALVALQVLLSEALSYLHVESKIWEERRAVFAGAASTKDAVKWRGENTLTLSEISELVRIRELGQQEYAQVLIDSEQRQGVALAPDQVELQKEILLRRQLAFDNLATIEQLLNDHLADLDRIRSVRQFKFIQEKVAHTANSIWGLQLGIVQDRTITVGKSVTAILLFLGGLIIARLLILRVLCFILRKKRVREGVAYAISQLLYYLVLLVLLFGAISYAGIPFHIFAFFGGALAIATGFGSQAIISNFLSGVILLLEGSIRVGDMVQVDDVQGRVKSIGLRHIQMTTFDNVDMLIPNARFLEENVVNWTLESETIRSNITVSVGFDAPPEAVMDTLVQVAKDHPEVFYDPPPEAFLEYLNSDNGYLRFKLYYWHKMPSPRERMLFNSAIQVEIIKRLRTQGIELASPTQDIITHRGADAGTTEHYREQPTMRRATTRN